MNLVQLFDIVSAPPPGSVNVQFGASIEGPGGRWVPCVVRDPSGVFYSSTFEVGAGRRQACAADAPFRCADEALFSAIELAGSASA
jgi:hypothetical protein